MAEKIISIQELINILVYGVPALIIGFGLFSYVSAYFINGLSQGTGMANTGFIMIILGVVLYALEFVVNIVATRHTFSDNILPYK